MDTPASDTDIKDVFLLPKQDYYGIDYVEQVNNASNDIVYYELGRFMQLLSLNNPNILELLYAPVEIILYKHPLLNQIDNSRILSKLTKDSFGKFAYAQIKKAKGLKKKIVNPIDMQRKNVLSFCYVNYQYDSVSLQKFLELRNWKQEHCGLVNIPHMKDVYGLFYSESVPMNGIVRNDQSNEVCLSSIPKELQQQEILFFNIDGYSIYCKEYREYWD